MEIPEKYIMKFSGSAVEYGTDHRYYNNKIKENMFDGQNGSIVPLTYKYSLSNREIGYSLGVAQLKTDGKGISADCYVIDTPHNRLFKEFVDGGMAFELGIFANNIETITHGDETIVTKGTIREISVIPTENVRYPVKIEKERKE